MVTKVDTAMVYLWGDIVGAVSWLDENAYGLFEYAPEFLNQGLDISPLQMSIDDAINGDGRFSFPFINKETFLGLPGLLADSLPDKFGNSIIDAWLVRNGRDSSSFSPVERLCYAGKRSMGALEFSPSIIGRYDESVPVEISELVELAQEIMNERNAWEVNIAQSEKGSADALMDILRVGTSAGGARPKAVIAMDQNDNVISGQATVPESYQYWILKFDGVTDMELGEPRGYGRIEFAYYLMALAAGIEMEESRLLEENGRAHFMTRRFDRVNGKKLHMQTLCGIAHFDFNMAGAYSYEQAFAVMRKLRLSKAEATEQFRRMVFNVIARDQDDHTKNIAYIMGPDGRWKLSPAYDVIYSHNPSGKWTNQHQMSLNGKRDNFQLEDLIAVGDSISLIKTDKVINEVFAAVERWPEFARQAGVNENTIKQISANHRLQMLM